MWRSDRRQIESKVSLLLRGINMLLSLANHVCIYGTIKKSTVDVKVPKLKTILVRQYSREGQFVQGYQKIQVDLEDPENKTYKQ